VSERIKVPCIKVCSKDRSTGWCLGCGRTGPEIARWWNLSPVERAAAMAELPRRLAALGLPEGGDREAGLRMAREQSLAAAAAILGEAAGPTPAVETP
jgi:predicted Fe-S protein YdhL (DUF1289 family)